MDWFSWLPWVRRRRRLAQQRAHAVAQAAQRAEAQAAIARILAAARHNDRPAWDARTLPLPLLNRVMMTRAGEHRTRRNERHTG